MARLFWPMMLALLLAGCSHHPDPEPVYQDRWVGVNVSHHSVDVRVRPGTEKGNVDVHTIWP